MKISRRYRLALCCTVLAISTAGTAFADDTSDTTSTAVTVQTETVAPPDTTTPTTQPAPADVTTSTTQPAPQVPVATGTAPVADEGVYSAAEWDGVWAEGVSLNALNDAALHLGGGDYTARPALSDASGAYLIPDSRWDGYSDFQRAADAPAEVQDSFVREQFAAITKRYQHLDQIAVAWYAPDALRDDSLMAAASADDPAHMMTPLEYQPVFEAAYTHALTAGSPPVLPANDPSQPYLRQIAFPVAGQVSFYNDWQACRDDCTRFHEGIDLIGGKGQLLRAATDGTITAIQQDTGTISGAFIEVTDSDGWRYVYRHVNNDTPGTNDGHGDIRWAFHPGLHVGSPVRAGQVIGYMGNSGNAEYSVPHLHFELRLADGTSVNPFPSLLAAQQREQCTIGVGPWSTIFDINGDGIVTAEDTKFTTGDPNVYKTRQMRAEMAEDIAERTGRRAFVPVYEPSEVVTFGDATTVSWQVSLDGLVFAPATAATIASAGECAAAPSDNTSVYGSVAAGTGIFELPAGWLDEDPVRPVEPMLRVPRNGHAEPR